MESGIHSSLHENCYHQLVCAKFNLEDGGHKWFLLCSTPAKKNLKSVVCNLRNYNSEVVASFTLTEIVSLIDKLYSYLS